jgi:DNA mismatch repair ATPase MutS
MERNPMKNYMKFTEKLVLKGYSLNLCSSFRTPTQSQEVNNRKIVKGRMGVPGRAG